MPPPCIPSIPAFLMNSGVSKSGSPALRFRISLPSLAKRFARELTAIVADGLSLLIF